MRSNATVLLLDDGELNPLGLLLFEAGLELTWKSGAEIVPPIPRPRDLLITNRRRALEIPHLIPDMGNDPGPAWICVHPKDFSSLREFLRELGAHFLLQIGPGGPDARIVHPLIRQLIHQSGERRARIRLPCACTVQCSANGERFEAELCDLSHDSCRIQVSKDIRVTTAISIYLPSEIDPAAPTAYPGVVLRTSLRDRDRHRFDVAIGFEDAGVQSTLAQIVVGQGEGTRIVQLNSLAAKPKPGEQLEIEIDRREVRRHRYRQRVACLMSLDDERPLVIMAKDLSMSGIRVDAHERLSSGCPVIVALPLGKGLSPLLIEGTVQGQPDLEGARIEFDRLGRDRAEVLRRMLSKLSPLEAHVDELAESDITLVGEDVKTRLR